MMRRAVARAFAMLLGVVLAANAPAFAARTILPGDSSSLVHAIAGARHGAVIVVPAGIYDIRDVPIWRSLTIKGEGEVVFTSSSPVVKGLLVPTEDVSLRVEHVTFRGARDPDQNGAGIRHEGLDLTVIDCVFEDDEDGILAAGSEFSRIRIERSKFLRNGAGDGYSHAIYVSSGESLDVVESTFVGTKIGHHVKSLAARTTVTSSTFDDTGGSTSYALDASRGGKVTFANNSVVKSADADNEAIVNYDLTRGGKALGLRIVGNRIVNRHSHGRLLRNGARLTPTIEGNVVVNEAGGRLIDADLNHPSTAATPAAATPPRQDNKSSASWRLEPLFPGPRQREGLIAAPHFAVAPGAAARLRLENPFPAPSPPGFQTFGQVFPDGALPAGTSLEFFSNGRATPAQIDVKTRYPDGSALHAAVTIMAPSLPPHGAVDGVFRRVTTGVTSPKFGDIPSFSFPIAVTFHDGAGARTKRVDAGPLIAEALRTRDALWLDGDEAIEARVETTLAPHLLLRVDARLYADGARRLSVAFSNENTFSAGARDLLYDVVIGPEAAPYFSAKDVRHYRASLWRRVFVAGPSPRLHVARDLAPFIAAGALPPIDVSQGASAAAIAELYENSSRDAPLAAAALEKYFPTTGGRADIGLMPQWSALALVAQTPAAFAAMAQNAEAAGAVPWHFRDEATGRPVSLAQHPNFWAEERGLEDQYGRDRPNKDLFAGSDGGWTPDLAHMPALAPAPYLLTADRYYSDELDAEAAFALAIRWPDQRRRGLFADGGDQGREGAWLLRSVSDAAFLAPDADPLKLSFATSLDALLSDLRTRYLDRRAKKNAGELEGWFDEVIDREPDRISPWQNDYVALALALAARRGSHDAAALLAWCGGFEAGRFLSPDFAPKDAFAYLFRAKDPATQKPYATWKAVYQKTFGPGAEGFDGRDGYPTTAAGYVASAYAALTVIASTTDDARALQALAVVARLSAGDEFWSRSAPSGVAADPQFLFALRRPDGETISRDAVGPRPDPARASFAYGTTKSDLLKGGAFADVLAGGDGDDVLLGGDGDDDLFGEAGDDTLDGGAGDNRLVGGEGGDAFVIGAGDDRILDFDPKSDLLVSPALAGRAPRDVAKDTPEGAKLTLPNGHNVILEHVSVADLRVDNFIAHR